MLSHGQRKLAGYKLFARVLQAFVDVDKVSLKRELCDSKLEA